MGTSASFARRFIALAIAFGLAIAWAPSHDALAADGSLVLQALGVLEDQYVDPVRPTPLLNAAIGELRHDTRLTAAAIPDIPAGTAGPEARDLFTHDFAAAAADAPGQDDQLAMDATGAMLASLHDSHTTYLPPQMFREAEAAMRDQAAFTGVGIIIGQITDHTGAKRIAVLDVFPGSPAAIAGLRRFDILEAVNGRAIGSGSLEDASSLIRGPAGTAAALTVVRAGHRFGVAVTRSPIREIPAWGYALPSGIGYLRIAAFTRESAVAVRHTLSGLGPIRGLILDLRGNPGGLVPEVRSVAGLFLAPGTTIAQFHGHNEPPKPMYARGAGPYAALPIAVLTDRGTASAAEILTGALKDARRAIVIGDRTAGALGGAVNIPLIEGGMSVTVERIQGPRGETVEDKGIEPDLTIMLTGDDVEAGRDPQLLAAEAALGGRSRADTFARRFARGITQPETLRPSRVPCRLY